jgi:hypothetical protein
MLKQVWRPVVAGSCVVFFVLIGLFWHRSFAFALLMNASMFIALVWAQWPSVGIIGWQVAGCVKIAGLDYFSWYVYNDVGNVARTR